MIRATYVEKNGNCSSLHARRNKLGWECLFFIQGTVDGGIWLGITEHEKERIISHINPFGWKYIFRIVNSDNLRIPPTVYFISQEHI